MPAWMISTDTSVATFWQQRAVIFGALPSLAECCMVGLWHSCQACAAQVSNDACLLNIQFTISPTHLDNSTVADEVLFSQQLMLLMLGCGPEKALSELRWKLRQTHQILQGVSASALSYHACKWPVP